MHRKSLSTIKNPKDLDRFAKKIKSSQYFRKISLFILVKMLSKGELLTLSEGEIIIQENESHEPELIILLEGSLIVTSGDYFIMRLNQPGEVFGEMTIIYPNQKLTANLISEETSKVVIFPYHLFKVEENENNLSKP